METSKFRRHAAVPKIPLGKKRTPFVPVLPDYMLAYYMAPLESDERATMRRLVDCAELLEVDGQKFLLAPVEDDMLDTLAAFGAAAEDMELEPDDEEEMDDDRENDNPADAAGIDSDDEDDFPNSRFPFIRERTEQYHRPIHRSSDGYTYQIVGHEIESRLELKHPGRDEDELRHAQRFTRGRKA